LNSPDETLRDDRDTVNHRVRDKPPVRLGCELGLRQIKELRAVIRQVPCRDYPLAGVVFVSNHLTVPPHRGSLTCACALC